KLGDKSVDTTKLDDGAVTATNIADQAVKSEKIADAAVTAAKLAPGAVTNAWKTGGNAGTTPGADFLGTTDKRPLELKVNGLRALRLEDNGDSNDSGTNYDGAPNLVGGSPWNFVSAGVVGSTIGGGGATNYNGLPRTNSVLMNFGTVGGGYDNREG